MATVPSCMRNLLVRSFGSGIMSAEIVPASAPSRPNVEGKEIMTSVRSSGIDVLEAVMDPEDSNKVYLLMPNGHRPTRYELCQMDRSDWVRLRAAVAAGGSTRFAARLAALDEELLASTS